jgi:hypothetical protein
MDNLESYTRLIGLTADLEERCPAVKPSGHYQLDFSSPTPTDFVAGVFLIFDDPGKAKVLASREMAPIIAGQLTAAGYQDVEHVPVNDHFDSVSFTLPLAAQVQ